MVAVSEGWQMTKTYLVTLDRWGEVEDILEEYEGEPEHRKGRKTKRESVYWGEGSDASNVADLTIEFNHMFLSESFIDDFISESTMVLAKAVAASLQRETEN